jgi:adenylate cyclase
MSQEREGSIWPALKKVALLAGIEEERVGAWREAGLFDRLPNETGAWVARAHMLSELERAGVRRDVLVAAHREDLLARAYVFEFLQVARRGANPLRHLVERTAMEEQDLLRLCDALGIDDPSLFSDAEVEFFAALAGAMADGLPWSLALELCEVWGAQMRFIAQAEVEAYDTSVARRLFAESDSPLEAAARLAPVTRSMLRAADLIVQPLHRRHLLQAINLEPDTALARQRLAAESLAPGEVEVAIGFIDLTGYTALTEAEGDRQAMAYARRLERLVNKAVRERSTRIVKRLGDGLMLAGPSARDLVDTLLQVVRELEARDDMPPGRAGASFGVTMARAGDYFGRTVNVAARVLDEAGAYEVLATDQVVGLIGGGPYAISAPRDTELEGIREPVRVWRVEPAAERSAVAAAAKAREE